MATYRRIALAVLFVLLNAATARAENIVLKCEHLSGAFHGTIWAVEVNLATGRIVFVDHAPVIGSISDRYIEWQEPRNKGGTYKRIDRATGQMTFNSTGHWGTVFGQPGVICSKTAGRQF
jgi:hypothetical protein